MITKIPLGKESSSTVHSVDTALRNLVKRQVTQLKSFIPATSKPKPKTIKSIIDTGIKRRTFQIKKRNNKLNKSTEVKKDKTPQVFKLARTYTVLSRSDKFNNQPEVKKFLIDLEAVKEDPEKDFGRGVNSALRELSEDQ